MPTFGQGAPGVRIRLRDASAVNLVTNPRITAGIVGYSSRGELNKIIDLTSTAEQDTILGNGYNNPKFNQGLYAARAVINAGGFVEYVRPYGEEIIDDDSDPDYATSQELKTDTFLVEYDFSSGAPTSFDIEYFASTRYYLDGLATKGKREILTIAKTLLENTNVDFEIDADAQTDYDSGTDKVALFAIMNSDPTAATRAGDRFVISSIVVNSTIATVTTASPHGFSTGDTVTIAGTVNYNESDVTITVTSTTTFTYTSSATVYGTETTGAVFKNEDTSESGVDYLSIKTVATGKATKKYDYLEIVGGASVITTANDGDTFSVVDASNTEYTLEFDNDSTVTSGNLAVEIVNTTFTSDYATDATIITAASGTGVKFLVGDAVTLTTTGTLPTGLTASTDYLVSAIDGDDITLILNDGTGTGITITVDGTGTIINQTAILRNIASALTTAGYGTTSSAKIVFDGALADVTNNLIKLGNGYASKFSINDYVMFSDLETATGREEISDLGLTAGTIYQVASVSIPNDTIGLKDATTGNTISITGVSATSTLYRVLNLTTAKVSLTVNDGNQKLRLDIVGKFNLTVPSATQDAATSFVDTNSLTYLTTASDLEDIATTTDGIVLDDAVGRTFLSLGLAVEDYQDIDFDGDQDRVFTLTADGEAVARIFLIVEYYFGGETYNFSGTIFPYVYNDLNLDIKEQANNVANGWKFVINENISLENAILDPNFDLSQSLYNENIESEFVQVAFNANDPAIVNDAVWEYDPRNNNGSAMLGQAWQLFLNKDEARADMFIAAGTAISNLFVKNMEAINYSVMDTMLDICEKRKDCFAIFDGVDEKKIDVALRKMVGIGSQGDISRWGALFDGRSIFFDSVYTKLNVEAVKSIEVAAIITLNRAANVYWLPPAGYETGRIPAALSSRQKYIRTYNYADDPTSDIARLYDANINPTRVNDQGQFIYGQKTMLKRMTALNRLNVIMLVAGIHKRFADFLDRKVFQLNTPALRNGITAELQAQLELIKSANPAGLTEGICICDDTNNTADIIDTNQLIVDIFLQPTRTAEFITLRTTVQRTGDTASIVSAQLIGG